MVVVPWFPFLSTPHSTILVFYETNIIDYQYKTNADTDHYIWKDNYLRVYQLILYKNVVVLISYQKYI